MRSTAGSDWSKFPACAHLPGFAHAHFTHPPTRACALPPSHGSRVRAAPRRPANMAAPALLSALSGGAAALCALSSIRLRRLRLLRTLRRLRSVLRRLRRRRFLLAWLSARCGLQAAALPPPSPRLWSKRRSCAFWETVREKAFSRREWTDNFRVAPATFDFLCGRLRAAIQRRDTSMRRAVPAEVRLALTLWRLGAGSEYRAVELRFGVSRSTVCKILRDVCEAVVADLGPCFATPPACVADGDALVPPPPPLTAIGVPSGLGPGNGIAVPEVGQGPAIAAPEVRQKSAVCRPEVRQGSAVARPEVSRGSAIAAPEVRQGSAIASTEALQGSAIAPEVRLGSPVAPPEVRQGSAIAPPSPPAAEGFAIPQLCGVLTRLRVPIRAPPEDAARYSDGRGWHAVVLQAVVDPRGFLWAVEVTPPGEGVRGSGLYRKAESGGGLCGPGAERELGGVPVAPFLLGGERDPLLPWLLRPYRREEIGEGGQKVGEAEEERRRAGSDAGGEGVGERWGCRADPEVSGGNDVSGEARRGYEGKQEVSNAWGGSDVGGDETGDGEGKPEMSGSGVSAAGAPKHTGVLRRRPRNDVRAGPEVLKQCRSGAISGERRRQKPRRDVRQEVSPHFTGSDVSSGESTAYATRRDYGGAPEFSAIRGGSDVGPAAVEQQCGAIRAAEVFGLRSGSGVTDAPEISTARPGSAPSTTPEIFSSRTGSHAGGAPDVFGLRAGSHVSGAPDVSGSGTGSDILGAGKKRPAAPDATSCATKRLRFNAAAAAARGAAAATLRRLRGRWRCLQKRNDGDVGFLPTLLAACCLLHNVCTARGDPLPPRWENGPGGEGGGADGGGGGSGHGEGGWAVREAVAEAMMG